VSKFFKALQQAEEERGRQSWPTVDLPDARAEPVDARDAPSEVASRAPGPSAVHSIEGVQEHLISLLRPSSFEAEQYRMLAHFVERLAETSATKVVGIASPAAGDGKTLTALNLAAILAQDQRKRVLVLEADLRQPVMSKYLGLPESERGLAQLIARTGLTLTQAVTRLSWGRLDVLTAGAQSNTPYEMLRSPRAEEVLREARGTYDHILVDMPPLVSVPEVPLIEKLVDGLLVVVRTHRTPRNLLEDGLRLVDAAKVLGLVFNGDDRLVSGFSKYYRYGGDKSARNGRGAH
jgi:protein-tyrosine kinase